MVAIRTLVRGVVAASLLSERGSALFFELQPGGARTEECFKVAPGAHHRLVGSYEADGVAEGVTATVFAPAAATRGRELWRSAESSAKFDVEADGEGEHTLCFQSSINEVQMVSFNYRSDSHGGHDALDAEHKEFVTQEHTSKVGDLVGQLESKASDILDQQQYAITREAVHRETAESTNTRVMVWTFVEVGALVALAAFQVWYLKSYFEVKQTV
eukprot:TRINITY_DN32920_c0_g1_i1.p1 TRINITY_DN32920_c0_g1~~TRINITY_DN32920_c0_g1_i1.p1  ORF type:complete len:215 (+),score=48.55 TRINITY_DN32920_c0_g1_i1:102-746(+)